MLNWLRGLFGGVANAATGGLLGILQGAISAIAGVIDTVFGHVTGAWRDLARWIDTAATFEDHLWSTVYGQLKQIITHDIPTWAWTAWWWVTHPDKLAAVLFWYLVRLLEDNAWQAAGILGEFILALILRNARKVAALLEQIVTAIL